MSHGMRNICDNTYCVMYNNIIIFIYFRVFFLYMLQKQKKSGKKLLAFLTAILFSAGILAAVTSVEAHSGIWV